jgi:hypothetical protein
MTGMPHPAFAEARITISLSEQHAYLENYSADLIQATIERANLFADEKLAKGESVNMGAIYKSAFSGKWGVQYLEQKDLQNKAQEKLKEPSPTKRKVSTKTVEPDQEKKLNVLDRWLALSDELKSEYFKRALNNLPKAMKHLEVSNATLANVMERPLLRVEIEKLLGTA